MRRKWRKEEGNGGRKGIHTNQFYEVHTMATKETRNKHMIAIHTNGIGRKTDSILFSI